MCYIKRGILKLPREYFILIGHIIFPSNNKQDKYQTLPSCVADRGGGGGGLFYLLKSTKSRNLGKDMDN